MLIPQYTIRWLLGLTTVCAVIFSIFAVAMRGSFLAAGVSMAIIALVVVILVHMVFFGLVWVFSAIFSRRSVNAARAGDSGRTGRDAGHPHSPGLDHALSNEPIFDHFRPADRPALGGVGRFGRCGGLVEQRFGRCFTQLWLYAYRQRPPREY